MLSTVPDLKADIVPVGYRHVAALLAMTNLKADRYVDSSLAMTNVKADRHVAGFLAMTNDKADRHVAALLAMTNLKADIVPVGYRHVAALLAMTRKPISEAYQAACSIISSTHPTKNRGTHD